MTLPDELRPPCPRGCIDVEGCGCEWNQRRENFPTCECGCGEHTGFWEKNDAHFGRVKGEPKRFIRGHHGRKFKKGQDYVTVDGPLDTRCWVSQRGVSGTGYTQVSVGGKRVLSHAYEWELIHGPRPRGKDLHHLCGNKRCCNPDHLELLTRSEHMLAHRLTEGKSA